MNTLRQIKLDALKGNEYVMINVVNNKGKIHLELLPYTFTGILNLFLSVDYSDEDLNNAINELDITQWVIPFPGFQSNSSTIQMKTSHTQ